MSDEAENKLCRAILISAYTDFHKALGQLYKKGKKRKKINGEVYGRYSLIIQIKGIFDFVGSDWFLLLNNHKDIRSEVKDRLIEEMYQKYEEVKADEKDFTKKCNC